MHSRIEKILDQACSQKRIRRLDKQFSLLISDFENDETVIALAAITSALAGKGHTCLELTRVKTVVGELFWGVEDYDYLLGLFDDISKVQQVLESSSLLNQDPSPLVFDGQRLYLQRYWHFEVQLARQIKQRALVNTSEAKLVSDGKACLQRHFARQYRRIWQQFKLQVDFSLDGPKFKQWLCDQLDVVDEHAIDWSAVVACFASAKSEYDLEKLDVIVPLALCLNWQKVAAATALLQSFTVISGGPGTGKTTTVSKLLAALVELTICGEQPTIKLVAPTGKAAARLTESMSSAIDSLAVAPEIKAQLPTEASTIHRLLGVIPNRVAFRHNQSNPLHLDVLVVDEASMVDLTLMYHLVQALPPHTRVILLGDRDQLASVEAGAVLADICSFSNQPKSSKVAKALSQLTGFSSIERQQALPSLSDNLCVLQKSYRFDARSGIGQLAKAVNNGDLGRVNQVFQHQFDDIELCPLDASRHNELIEQVAQAYKSYLTILKSMFKPTLEPLTERQETLGVASIVKSAMTSFNQSQLLCAVREGEFGVTGLNTRVEAKLRHQKYITKDVDDLWYHGRPIMVTENDHTLGLFNGDIGLCVYDPEADRLKVYFEQSDGEVRSVLPSRVPPHETAYAMTIHKSQGSEFEHVWMILPTQAGAVLSRELIYTGITRAKKTLKLYTSPTVLSQGVQAQTERSSGLKDKLAV